MLDLAAISQAPFDQVFAEAERLHRLGRQRTALAVIGELAVRLPAEPEVSLHALLNLIFLRKRVWLALSEA